jgi:2-methylcitrate dehydratase
VGSTVLKRFNAEIHSQSAIEAILDLRAEHHIDPLEIGRVELEIFQVGYDIIGGGAEGDKRLVWTKEDADHSLPYLLAVALLDGTVMPEQFLPERIVSADVQRLLERVDVHPAADLSSRFPGELACRVRVRLHRGRLLEREKADYEGWRTRPMQWERVAEKFRRLTAPVLDPGLGKEITEAVHDLHLIDVGDLTGLLAASSTGKEESP